MTSDPLSNMLVSMMNAARAGKPYALVPASNFKEEVARVLAEEGFLTKVVKKGKKVRKFLQLELAYKGGAPLLGGVRRLSRPSRRIYVGVADLPKYGNRMTVILSTPKGVMTGRQAKKDEVGGELLCQVW